MRNIDRSAFKATNFKASASKLLIYPVIVYSTYIPEFIDFTFILFYYRRFSCYSYQKIQYHRNIDDE